MNMCQTPLQTHLHTISQLVSDHIKKQSEESRMAYQERIKNFSRIRSYIRDFFVFGYKVRDEYDKKSARTYDDERKHIDSWFGDHLKYKYGSDGKINYLSVDSRNVYQNPLYKAFKTSSFTDTDITLHFAFMSIFADEDILLTVQDVIERTDAFLHHFSDSNPIDQSTIRKKLTEYEKLGLLTKENRGRKLCYHRSDYINTENMADAISFFSETVPCGVIGSYIQDCQQLPPQRSPFLFKQDYFASALDSEVMCQLLIAIQKKSQVALKKENPSKKKCIQLFIIPLRIAVNAQTGREYLLAYDITNEIYQSYRIDYIISVEEKGPAHDFQTHREHLSLLQQHMWGVELNNNLDSLEHVEITFHIDENEQHIIKRLMREKHCGTIKQIDNTVWRFTADVTNSAELLPWIRTYICRIVKINMSNKNIYKTFMDDLHEMAQQYDLAGGADK